MPHFLRKGIDENIRNSPSEAHFIQDFANIWLGSPLCTLTELFGVFLEKLCINFWMHVRFLVQVNSVSPSSYNYLKPTNMLLLILASLILEKITLKYWKQNLFCCSTLISCLIRASSLCCLVKRELENLIQHMWGANCVF